MSFENAKANLKEFAKELNLEGLAFDENNTCILGIDNEFSLHLTYVPEPDRLYIYAPVLDGLPKDDKTKLRLYELLLEGSMLGGQMAGGGAGVAVPEELILMHCVSAYPTPIEEANTLSIPYLAERTGLRVGYSNHVIGMEACLAAVAVGACALEVHFTDCKTGRDFRDHALSLDPDDLGRLVDMAPKVKASLGARDKAPQPCELENRQAVRKGVVAARDLKAGDVLSRDDLMFARPATEFPASDIDTLVGAALKEAVGKGELIDGALEITEIRQGVAVVRLPLEPFSAGAYVYAELELENADRFASVMLTWNGPSPERSVELSNTGAWGGLLRLASGGGMYDPSRAGSIDIDSQSIFARYVFCGFLAASKHGKRFARLLHNIYRPSLGRG